MTITQSRLKFCDRNRHWAILRKGVYIRRSGMTYWFCRKCKRHELNRFPGDEIQGTT